MRKLLRHTTRGIMVLAAAALLSQCSDSDRGFLPHVDREPAASIAIHSGNNQYSLRGTELPEALVVEVTASDGSAIRGVPVTFSATAGGGSLSETTVNTDDEGLASTRLTLGAELGVNRVAAVVRSDPGLFAVFEAISSNYLCPEAENTLAVCGDCPDSYGPKDDLFLVTARSTLYPDNAAGVVQVNVSSEAAFGFVEIPPDQMFFTPIIWDATFSPRGDFYVARRTIFPEILKIDVSGTISRFASLEPNLIDDSVEITANSVGLIVGVDITGPFAVRCRDELLRFPEATFVDDGVNNDALAVDPRRHSDDPLGEDIYFIHRLDRTLYRLPLDSLAVEPQGLQTVTTQLTADQATGARGMVCDDLDGTVYALIDTENTKELLKISPGGIVTQLFDFFSRGSGSEEDAGIQRDLAIRKPFLFTLDTLNDKLLVFDLAGTLTPLFSDSLEQAKLSERDSAGNLSGGERVGLAVLK